MKNKVYKVLLSFLAVIIVFMCTTVVASAASSYESEANDSYDTADTLKAGKSISGTMDKAGDSDLYKIVAPDNGKISLKFSHRYSDYDSWKYWEIWIYQYTDGVYNELSYKQIFSSDNENITLPYIGARKNGVYYIKVYSYRDRTIGENYTITSSFTKSDYYEKENNDDFYKANKITLGKSISATMNHTGDSDLYKIVAPDNGKISLKFSHKFSAYDSWKYWEIWIYQYTDGAYNELSYKQIFSSDNENISLPYIGAKKNGTYYVKVYSYRDRTIGENYTITSSFIKSDYYEKENNDDFYKANKITLGKSISATMNHTGDSDLYKIVAPDNGKISLKFSHKFSAYDSWKYWEIWIYQYTDGAYNELSYKQIFSSDNENISLPYIGAKKNGTYYVKVYSYRDRTIGENYTIKTSVQLSTPKLTKISNSSTGVRIDWTKVGGAQAYIVYRKSGSGSWKKIGETKNVAYTDKTAKSGTKYYYAVKAKSNIGISTLSKSLSTVYLSVPTFKTSKNTQNSITLQWSKVTGATGYKVYQYSSSKGKFVEITTVTGTSYKKIKLKPGTTYKFKVKAYKKLSNGKIVKGFASEEFVTATKCVAPKITSIVPTSNQKVTLKWSGAAGATGYQVYYSTKKDSGYEKVISTASKSASKTFSKSAKGKKIYFKVRAYKKVNGKTIFGSWSTVKSTVVK